MKMHAILTQDLCIEALKSVTLMPTRLTHMREQQYDG